MQPTCFSSNVSWDPHQSIQITAFVVNYIPCALSCYLVLSDFSEYNMLGCLSRQFWQCTLRLIEIQTSTLNRTSTLSGHDNWSISNPVILIEN